MPKTVTVTLDQPQLAVGATTQAAATMGGLVERDGLIDARKIVWTSGTPTVATVSADGLVTGVSAGTAEIKATVKTVSGSATVTVAVAGIRITAEQEAAILAVAEGDRFQFVGPTGTTIDCQRTEI